MTTTTITKPMLQQLAEAGVRQRLADLERELAAYHKMWPDVFLSPTAPQLLKAMPKGSTNGHWPATTFTKTTGKDPSSAMKAAWTPQRRAAQARRMKRQRKQGKTKKRKPGRLAKVHAYLQKHGDSPLKDIMAATGYDHSSGLISAMANGLKSGRFKRTGKGQYALGSKD